MRLIELMPQVKLFINTTWRIIWRVGLFFLGWGLLLSLFIIPFSSKIPKWVKTNPLEVQIYSNIIIAVTILAVTWVMLRFIDHRPFRSIGFSIEHIFRDILTGLAIGISWLGFSLAIAWTFRWTLLIVPIGFSWSVLIISSISMLLNVIAQELLLCGFIFQTVRKHSNTIIAIVVSSVLFTGYHAGAFKGEWLPVVNVFSAGVLFCFAYIITNNLWFSIFIHFTWDVLLGPVLGMTESGQTGLGGSWKIIEVKGPTLFTGGHFGLEGGMIVTFITILIITLMYLFYRRRINAQSISQTEKNL